MLTYLRLNKRLSLGRLSELLKIWKTLEICTTENAKITEMKNEKLSLKLLIYFISDLAEIPSPLEYKIFTEKM